MPVVAGTPDWQVTRPGPAHAIEGFADRTSVLPGDPVRLFVSTTAAGYTATAYRMGAYINSEALQVWRSAHQLTVPQPAATIDPATRMVSAGWRPSLTVPTIGWAPGDYLVRLDSDDGFQRFVPLTVRSTSTTGRVVMMNAVTTWQAYNRWGGASLYAGVHGRADVDSYDRPYDYGDGAADFLSNELPLLVLAERLDLPLAYLTSLDVHGDAHALDGARALLSPGHDEYWSLQMREAVTAARDAGMNIGFFGANAVYRHIRLQPSALGPDRQEVNYRDFTADPIHGTAPYDATQEWRRPPRPRPESVLTGSLYECNGVKADMVVADASSWLLRDIAIDGEHLAGVVGDEYDRVTLSAPTPRPIQVLFHSPLRCRGMTSVSDATWYTTPSGAGVFDSGTSAWVSFLGNRTTPVGTVLTTATTRLLEAFAQGPAGLVQPAVDNLVRVGIRGATPAPAEPVIPRQPLRD